MHNTMATIALVFLSSPLVLIVLPRFWRFCREVAVRHVRVIQHHLCEVAQLRRNLARSYLLLLALQVQKLRNLLNLELKLTQAVRIQKLLNVL